MIQDQDFPLYPLDTGGDPVCPECGTPMGMATREAKEDGTPEFIAFRCEQCGRTEKFVSEE
jgi:tRNA(Ile2) C34 agmatinyltransferase TiaS